MSKDKFDTFEYRTLLWCVESDIGAEWIDKPHRIVYDLCDEIERLQNALLELGRADLLAVSEE